MNAYTIAGRVLDDARQEVTARYKEGNLTQYRWYREVVSIDIMALAIQASMPREAKEEGLL